jgi:hypothetical protein
MVHSGTSGFAAYFSSTEGFKIVHFKTLIKLSRSHWGSFCGINANRRHTDRRCTNYLEDLGLMERLHLILNTGYRNLHRLCQYSLAKILPCLLVPPTGLVYLHPSVGSFVSVGVRHYGPLKVLCATFESVLTHLPLFNSPGDDRIHFLRLKLTMQNLNFEQQVSCGTLHRLHTGFVLANEIAGRRRR